MAVTLTELSHMRGHGGGVQVGIFNSGGTYALTGGVDKAIALWNPYRAPYSTPGEESAAGTGALLLKQYRGHGMDVRDLAVTLDSARFASVGGDRFGLVWDVESGEVVRRVYGHDAAMSAVAFGGAVGEGECLLLTGGDDMCVRVGDLRAPPTRGPIQVLKGCRDKVTGVACSGGCVMVSSLDGTLRTWDMRAAKVCVDTLPSAAGGGGGGAGAVGAPPPPPPPVTAFSIPPSDFLHAAGAAGAAGAIPPPSGVLLAATTRGGGGLCLLDRPSGTLLTVCRGHVNKEYRLHPTMLPGHRHIGCGGEDGSLHVWDILTPDTAGTGVVSPALTLPFAHSKAVAYVDAREGGTHAVASLGRGAFQSVLLTSSHDATCKLWGVRHAP